MKKRINWKPYIIAGSVSFALGIGIFCLCFFAFKISAIDGTAYTSIALLGASGLMWIAREGFFDFATYGFRQFRNMLFSKNANEYNDFSGYKAIKNEVREKKTKSFIAVAAVGLIYLIVAIILLIISKH